ncbi:MAG: NAD-dependent epimerase/dehydratase family protein [Cyclobacteriaceae bacterium]|nr:NAD-dependent epimerase/dehydratase family protein [Cyclobacteriaceae bacterium HetDA_MAG_MS6]
MKKILVIGAGGQLGTELTIKLRTIFGKDNVVASDIRDVNESIQDGPVEKLDAMDAKALREIVKKHQVEEVYHLAAILSAKGENNPRFAWDLNMNSLLNVLELGRESVKKIYWPSSIAVFGPDTPKDMTPQFTVMNPTTVYGISKVAGERWCAYYHHKYGVDVRSLRYPGLIGYKSLPGGGTTDYAVDIFSKALKGETFQCFLGADTELPMMYMEDAVRATIELMQADSSAIKVRSSYNIAAMSFAPRHIYDKIKTHFTDFQIKYEPDYRQEIADSWPNSIDDSAAQEQWNWQAKFDLEKMTEDILMNLRVGVVD